MSNDTSCFSKSTLPFVSNKLLNFQWGIGLRLQCFFVFLKQKEAMCSSFGQQGMSSKVIWDFWEACINYKVWIFLHLFLLARENMDLIWILSGILKLRWKSHAENEGQARRRNLSPSWLRSYHPSRSGLPTSGLLYMEKKETSIILLLFWDLLRHIWT